MNEYADSLLGLPGTEAEQNWLREHLETLSVKGRIVLAAAIQRSPPETQADAVNHLLTLDEYDVCPACNYEELGEFYLWEKCVSQEYWEFFDKTALGQWYKDEHPGLFIGNCYVAYPEAGFTAPYDGQHLPIDAERLDWSVQLRIASKSVPDGVWAKLPDYKEFNYGTPDEILYAMDALGVNSINDCILLEARCILPFVRDLAGQYDNLADLIYDGQSLGFILDERGQGNSNFLDRYFAALEYEGCRRLNDAVSIAGEPSSYSVINVAAFLDDVMRELSRQAWAQDGEGVRNCFDYVAYSEAIAKQQGYRLTDNGQNYIRKRDSPTLGQQPTGMRMQ